jgi:hypothetical protein
LFFRSVDFGTRLAHNFLGVTTMRADPVGSFVGRLCVEDICAETLGAPRSLLYFRCILFFGTPFIWLTPSFARLSRCGIVGLLPYAAFRVFPTLPCSKKNACAFVFCGAYLRSAFFFFLALLVG